VRAFHRLVRAGVMGGLLLAISTGATAAAYAQDGSSSSAPTGQATAPAPLNAGSNEVGVSLERFGVGNQARAGDWFGIRVALNDSATAQRELIVRLETEDTDGDRPAYQLSLTSNPGLTQSVWLYGRMPFGASGTMRVSVYAAQQSNPGEVGAPGYAAGALLGSMAVTPRAGALVDSTSGMIGVVGTRALGLQQYGVRAGANDPFHAVSNELQEIVTGITPEDFPDRWMGLAPLSAIVWADGDPTKLRGDTAAALKDYISRGGHLVIILPLSTQNWINQSSNELFDILPDVNITTKENIDFAPYRALLTSWNGATFPAKSSVHTFTPRSGGWQEAVAVLNNPQGECVVSRREVGAGAVTLVGLDLNQTALSQLNLIDAEVFWHRVLGKRGDLLEPVPDPNNPRPAFSNATSQRRIVYFDGDIAAMISKSGRSATGVLVGFVVFVLYWAIAGPVGFALLKRRGQSQHSWLFFVGSSLVFTVFAWGGATILRPKRTEATHLTLLDHVYGQPLQRARMWASVLIPRYGEATLAVGEPGELGGAARGEPGTATRKSLNTIAPWDQAELSSGAFGGFSDTRSYTVDTRAPDAMTVPVRQTVKQIVADWAGGPRWEMPTPVGQNGATGLLSLNPVEQWRAGTVPLAKGVLQHNLPGALRNVTIMIVYGTRTLPVAAPRRTALSAIPAPSPVLGAAYSWREAWEPGAQLSLEAVTMPTGGASDVNQLALETYFKQLVPTIFESFTSRENVVGGDPLQRVRALAYLPQLPQPDFQSGGMISAVAAPLRTHTHGWDLGRWFTRPCIIITGEIGAGERIDSPVPLLVDARAIRSEGVTVVRWIYPLPDSPPAFPNAPSPGAPPVAPALPQPSGEPPPAPQPPPGT
jgi:hypothetical protein